MRDRLVNFMRVRNGFDALGIILTVLALALIALGSSTRWTICSLLGCIVLVWAVFRIFSRDIPKRRSENAKLMQAWPHLLHSIKGRRMRRRQSKEYKFFRCPGCKNRLRVPRGKGDIQIVCPRCGQRFGGRT